MDLTIANMKHCTFHSLVYTSSLPVLSFLILWYVTITICISQNALLFLLHFKYITLSTVNLSPFKFIGYGKDFVGNHYKWLKWTVWMSPLWIFNCGFVSVHCNYSMYTHCDCLPAVYPGEWVEGWGTEDGLYPGPRKSRPGPHTGRCHTLTLPQHQNREWWCVTYCETFFFYNGNTPFCNNFISSPSHDSFCFLSWV